MKARLAPIALEDIERGAEWYERKRVGLGLEFSERVLECIEKIELNPFGYERVYGEARRAELVQFPYSLWFKIENEAVVIACLHERRDQVLARERAFEVIEMTKREDSQ